jgi:hypothetical protein
VPDKRRKFKEGQGMATPKDMFPLGLHPDTRILTPRGEIALKSLKIGDVVETLHGGIQPIKWIGHIRMGLQTLAANPRLNPVLITAGALDDGIPAKDLITSPGLGICIDGGLIPAIRLVNQETILQPLSDDPVEYLQIELDEHELILASACPVETATGTHHEVFHNSDDFHALYPTPLPWPPVPCLPRLEQGFVLDAISQRINERAGFEPATPTAGPLHGFVDAAGPLQISGWAQCKTDPETPVCLDILVDGVRILRALANRYRPDLDAAGLGSGNHAFCVQLPEPATGPIEIRRTLDQQPLPLTNAAKAEAP